MAPTGPLSTFRLPDAVRRRLEVATATASQALLETHGRYGLHLVRLLRDQLPFDEVVDRYVDEMSLGGTMAASARTRIFVALEAAERQGEGGALAAGDDNGGRVERSGLERLRRLRPDVVVKDIRQRQRRNEEADRLLQLGFAQAEEGILRTHIENALDFVALLDGQMSHERAVEQYLSEVGLSGCRAQAVLQRTMCRLADAQLPGPPVPSPRREPARERTGA